MLISLSSALIMGGAVLSACYWWTLHESAAAQQRAKAWLNRMTQVDRPARLTPIRRGAIVGELKIPRLDVSVMVLEGVDPGILRIGAGHIPGTVLSPSAGNIGIAAHRDTYFRPLRLIQANDVITLETPAGTSRYSVTETEIVPPSDVDVLSGAPGRDLTLVTCYPFFYLGSAPKRFIVHARKTS